MNNNTYILDTILDKPYPHTIEHRKWVDTCGEYLFEKGYDNQYYDIEVYGDMFVIIYADTKEAFSNGDINTLVYSFKKVHCDSKRFLFTNRPASYIISELKNMISPDLQFAFMDNLGIKRQSFYNKLTRGSFSLKDVLKSAKFCGFDILCFEDSNTETKKEFEIDTLLKYWK